MVLGMSRPWKHPKTGVYWFRKVVPEALRGLVGKVEIRRSLRTKDPREAALRHVEVAAKIATEWEALRRGPVMADLARNFVQHLGPDGRAALAEDLLEVDMRAAGVLDERELPYDWEPGDRTPATQKAISRVIERRGLASWIERAIPHQLSRGQMVGLLESLEAVLLYPDADQSVLTAQPTPAEATSVTLTGILEGWWTEARATGRKPSTHESYRNTVVGLVAFLEHDSAKLVTPEDIVRFKDHRLASINPRTGRPISGKTVKDSDLAGLKTLFGWAVSNRKLPSNPATGVTIKLGKPQKLRGKGLTEEEARAILSAAMKVDGAGRTDAARRWVPWLAAYTGARVGELAQLRKQDVTKDGEHWTIRLTPEAGTIKTNEARTVVLHPHLVELGFPAFVEAAPTGHLFLKPNKSGDVLGPLQGLKNRLAEFSRAIVTDPNVAPMHGFRHRFKTVGMDAGVSTRVLDAIQGHAARTAGDGYGDVTVKAMAQAMEKVPRVAV
jgi:integrase